MDCDCVNQVTEDNSHPIYLPKDSNLKNGWYSEIQAQYGGYVVYLHSETGEEMAITEMSYKAKPVHNYPDQKFVGVVDASKHIRGAVRQYLREV